MLFGDVPAKEVSYVCPELLTCVAPPSGDDERSRTVDVRLVSAVSGRASRWLMNCELYRWFRGCACMRVRARVRGSLSFTPPSARPRCLHG